MVLTRIDNIDLNLFEFDYDLTMMIFFLDADGHVYGRYGGRTGEDPDAYQTLAGLQYTMQSVLDMHKRKDKKFAALSSRKAKYFRTSVSGGFRRRGCMHCHQIKEAFYAQQYRKGTWTRDMVWRYPEPDNLGITLDVDQSNVVKKIKAGSPAAEVGLKPGDVLTMLNDVPVHSFGDAQFSLDRAPKMGTVNVAWRRGDKVTKAKLALFKGWRAGDIRWRASVWRLVPDVPLAGTDLTAEERTKLGLTAKQVAFRHRERVYARALAAGVRGGDIIIGVDGKRPELNYTGFYFYIRRHYLAGDRITLNLLRDGKRIDIPLTLAEQRY